MQYGNNIPSAANNPFVYSRPVEPHELIDREAEARELLGMAEGGHAARLSAPRRYGKTSLLRRLMADAAAAGLATVYVDFYGVLSLQDVALRLEEAYRRELQGQARRTAVNLLRSLRPTARVAPGGIGVEVSPQAESESLRLIGSMLDLPLSLLEKTGRRSLVVFDEFQDLLAAESTVDGLFRSRIQHHGDAASYVFAGSHVGLMRQLFAQQERPFYGQARPLQLAPLPDADIADYVGTRFGQNGRDPGDALEPLLDAAAGHPQRAMLLAYHLWAATPPGTRADADSWADALEATFAELEESFVATWAGLEPKQRAVLAAVAASSRTLYDRSTLARFNLTKASAQAARDRLLEIGEHLDLAGGRPHLVDPLLAAWIRRRYEPSG